MHLNRAIHNRRTRHAYLLTGPDQIGKTTLARAFAAALNCTGDNPPCGACRTCRLILKDAHPDVSIVEADGNTLKIEQIRDLQQTLALRPYEARYRVAILRRFQQATVQAADALLKTLEEPAPHAVLILTADATDSLRPTIISRCQLLHLRPLPLATVEQALQAEWGTPAEQAGTLAALSGGRIGWAIRAFDDPEALEERTTALDLLENALLGSRRERFALVEQIPSDKTVLFTLLDLWQGYWRDVLLVASGSQTPLTNVDRVDAITDLARIIGREAAQNALTATRRAISYLHRNANTRLTLEVLMLDYPTP